MINCLMCGACCIAYDISTLDKPAGVPCEYLLESGRCGDYDRRPAVCAAFKADELCIMLSMLPLSERVRVIREVYRCS
ncbi:YkgJ family cysteine cluster protein [Deferribacterales bacterium RsTz2092]